MSALKPSIQLLICESQFEECTQYRLNLQLLCDLPAPARTHGACPTMSFRRGLANDCSKARCVRSPARTTWSGGVGCAISVLAPSCPAVPAGAEVQAASCFSMQ